MAKLVYEYILIRYGELTTKGKNKKDFIKRLADNMKLALSDFPALVFERTRDHIYIHLNGTDPDRLIPVLKKVFGIRSFAKTLKVDNDIEAIIQAGKDIMEGKEGTFKVIAKRANKNFEISSDKVNRMVASEILKNHGPALKVDVHNPDYKLIVEIREKNTYLMAETHLGAQGFPVGVGAKAMLMLSGGIDSPVAGYLMMKRGVEIECIHYASMPYTSLEALNKVKELTRLISVYQGQIRLHIIPFTETQLQIYRVCDESYAITMMRRMMYRLAQRLAEKRRCLAIVNGESIGQVASQTLESMAVISDAADMPVIRPCATMDKLEIINIAKQIGTYETSILPYEDCCTIFTPKNPVTKPKKEKCQWYEEKYDFEPFLQKALENVETLIINPATRSAENEDLF
ncbi:MAG TPA: tRNA uracil 4-sulfurtransferase ThiI [Erysipelotrichaceae bacterium]|nr:tRNA uracil 4-sulfurtransferase ThiI [Erysipelotrichaceae bacterium]